jgi:hypothetical protein
LAFLDDNSYIASKFLQNEYDRVRYLSSKDKYVSSSLIAPAFWLHADECDLLLGELPLGAA